jgi:sugar/nucleoside kinase (ribokinase family)
LKLGSRGAILSPAAGEYIELPAIVPPQPIVDTTGAGDAFYAGLIAGLLRGQTLVDAGRIGAAAGAACATALGATAGLLDWNATRRLAGLD